MEFRKSSNHWAERTWNADMDVSLCCRRMRLRNARHGVQGNRVREGCATDMPWLHVLYGGVLASVLDY